MSYQRSKIDLLWTDSGDFSLDTKRGDLADTINHSYRALIQQISTRISSSKNDWRLIPNLGANLSQALGRPNTRELGNEIKGLVTSALLSGTLLTASELEVDVFPVSKTEIAILIIVTPAGDKAQIRLNFTYNTKDNKIIQRNL